MKKPGERVRPFHVRCPFCDFLNAWPTPYAWCGQCYVEYYKARSGDVVFDTLRKTPRFAIAKALGKAGGMKLGDARIDDPPEDPTQTD
jgi:hypothetical protein